MNRAEQAELAELIVRAINCARDEMAALYATDLDMALWTATGDSATQARRELFECLFRITTSEERESTAAPRL